MKGAAFSHLIGMLQSHPSSWQFVVGFYKDAVQKRLKFAALTLQNPESSSTRIEPKR
jgi:hypothetical protein